MVAPLRAARPLAGPGREGEHVRRGGASGRRIGSADHVPPYLAEHAGPRLRAGVPGPGRRHPDFRRVDLHRLRPAQRVPARHRSPTPPGRIASGAIWFRGINLLAGSENEATVHRGLGGKPKLVRNDSALRRHRARMAKVRGREVSMIFQEPMSSLNPVLPVGYQIAEVLIYQRRKMICDRLLARKATTDEDLELFKEAVTHPDAAQRERLLTDFCLQTALPVEKVAAIIDRSGLQMEERLARIRRLSERSRTRYAWFLRLARELDVLESEWMTREWRVLSGGASSEDHPRPPAAPAHVRSRQILFKLVMSIPVLRRILMRPIEEEARRRVLEQLKNVRISEPHKVYNEYPHELSGGMQQRVMIAMALACDPALMIADEPTTSLDVTTQAQILTLVRDLRERIHSSILYITHDLAVIAELCDRVAVMYAGKVVEEAPVGHLFW